MLQAFIGSQNLAEVKAWGYADLKVSQKTTNRAKVFTLSVKVAPFGEGSRSVLADLTELEGLGEFVAKESGLVWLGAFRAFRSRGVTRIGFSPSKEWDMARLYLIEFIVPQTADSLALLGGEESEEERSSDALHLLGGNEPDCPFDC